MINSLKKMIPSGFKKQFKLFLHKGDKYLCPFCNYSSKDLAVTGLDLPVLKEKQVVGGGKRFGDCHNCGSSDRERLIYIYLKEKVNIFKSEKIKKILHIAPEKNLSKKLLEVGFDQYVCGDLFTEGYIYPKHVQNINILNVPFPENTFDLVICNHVLEHIPTDLIAMKELARVLVPGGQAILQVPISTILKQTFEDFTVTDSKQRETVFGQFDHVRIYGQDYVERLISAGFKVERVNISQEYMKFGLNKDEDIFVCSK